MPSSFRTARRNSSESLVNAARVLKIATRYPHLEVEALAERFGAPERTIYNVLNAAGIYRSDTVDRAPVRAPVHPWRPALHRRSPQQIAMSGEERQRLVDDFLAKKSVTKITRGVMTMSDVIFADQMRSE